MVVGQRAIVDHGRNIGVTMLQASIWEKVNLNPSSAEIKISGLQMTWIIVTKSSADTDGLGKDYSISSALVIELLHSSTLWV